jgi:hypothetical protein
MVQYVHPRHSFSRGWVVLNRRSTDCIVWKKDRLRQPHLGMAYHCFDLAFVQYAWTPSDGVECCTCTWRLERCLSRPGKTIVCAKQIEPKRKGAIRSWPATRASASTNCWKCSGPDGFVTVSCKQSVRLPDWNTLQGARNVRPCCQK